MTFIKKIRPMDVVMRNTQPPHTWSRKLFLQGILQKSTLQTLTGVKVLTPGMEN